MKDRSVPKQHRMARPYNIYNIYFILERALLSQTSCVQQDARGDAPAHQPPSSSTVDFLGYDDLCLPDLPPRYLGLHLPPDWFVPGKNARRKHVATNGLRNFTALARTVASNWLVVDDVTLSYCQSVAQLIKERHAELMSKVQSRLTSHQEQHQKKKSTTTAPLLRADTNSSCQREQQSSVDHHINTSSLNQAAAVGTVVTRRPSIHDMEHVSASTTPPSKSFERVETHDSLKHDDYLGPSNERHRNLTRMSSHQNPTGENNIQNIYDMFPPDWANLNPAPDIDEVNITDLEVSEMWGLH